MCLDMLRSRRARPEQVMDLQLADNVAAHVASADPEQEALLADSLGLALLVVLETLTPAERVSFGGPGLVWEQGRQVRVVFGFTISGDRIVGIDLIADPERISELQIKPG